MGVKSLGVRVGVLLVVLLGVVVGLRMVIWCYFLLLLRTGRLCWRCGRGQGRGRRGDVGRTRVWVMGRGIRGWRQVLASNLFLNPLKHAFPP